MHSTGRDREGVLPPLMIQPIEFGELRRRQQQVPGGGRAPIAVA